MSEYNKFLKHFNKAQPENADSSLSEREDIIPMRNPAGSVPAEEAAAEEEAAVEEAVEEAPQEEATEETAEEVVEEENKDE